jgi:ferredoxin-NADP reductase
MERPVYHARIERITEHAANTRSFFLRLDQNAAFSFVPGQFISLALPVGEKGIVRPYSIASTPEDGQPLEICLNLVPGGDGSKYLFELSVGAPIDFTGPFGSFTLSTAPDAETIFVAETTAIAPIRPMIRRALSATGPALKLLYAAPNSDRLLYRAEFDQWSTQHTNFRFDPLIVNSATNADALLEALHDRIASLYVQADTNGARHFFICGVGKGVLRIRDLLRSSGYERRAVHYEQW